MLCTTPSTQQATPQHIYILHVSAPSPCEATPACTPPATAPLPLCCVLFALVTDFAPTSQTNSTLYTTQLNMAVNQRDKKNKRARPSSTNNKAAGTAVEATPLRKSPERSPPKLSSELKTRVLPRKHCHVAHKSAQNHPLQNERKHHTHNQAKAASQQ